MTNGSDYPPDHVIGKCKFCKKEIKSKDRMWHESIKKYVHMKCRNKVFIKCEKLFRGD